MVGMGHFHIKLMASQHIVLGFIYESVDGMRIFLGFIRRTDPYLGWFCHTLYLMTI